MLENKDTYDGLRISLKHIDENESVMQYSNRVVSIESEGPIRVLGDSHQSLVGGQLSLYVLSEQGKGKAKVKVKMDDIIKEVEIEVK